MEHKKFSIKSRLDSFKYAFNGFKTLFLEEHNSRIHLFIALFIIILGFLFNISNIEWLFIVFCIGLVFFAELINSSIENIADFVSPEKHHSIKKVKDLAAAAVLTGAITSVIIGLIIFLPKIYSLL